MKLGDIELKLVKAESLNLAQVEEIADLKASLKACEDKWYNASFTDTENSAESIVHEERKLGFQESWMATLQAIGVPNDSPLRNPK